jgi:hypothetical protein
VLKEDSNIGWYILENVGMPWKQKDHGAVFRPCLAVKDFQIVNLD